MQRPCHIIVACDCNKCMKYSPFQGKWNHASWHGLSLCQWWTWQFNAPNKRWIGEDVRTWKYP
jgi:hypothetical protein